MKNTAYKKLPLMTMFAWLGYWLIWVLMFSNGQQPAGAVWAATVNVGLQAGIVYINMLVLIPSFLEKRKYVFYGMLCFALLILFAKLQLTLVPADDSRLFLHDAVSFPEFPLTVSGSAWVRSPGPA